MKDFTASNGVRVRRINDWTVDVEATFERYGVAIREFFRAEEDERLGRWRDQRYPDFVVYPWTAVPSRAARGVTVVSERIPRIYTVWEDNIHTLYGERSEEQTRRTARDVAAAYFDAHPEPKPWHDANHNEIWVLFVAISEEAYRVDGGSFVPVNNPERIRIPLTDERIKSARRIYPEGEK